MALSWKLHGNGKTIANDEIVDHVDFSRPVNQFTAAVALVIGIGNLSLATGDIQITGIALGTIAAVVVYHGMSTVERLRS